jgi:hypothetical protein
MTEYGGESKLTEKSPAGRYNNGASNEDGITWSDFLHNSVYFTNKTVCGYLIFFYVRDPTRRDPCQTEEMPVLFVLQSNISYELPCSGHRVTFSERFVHDSQRSAPSRHGPSGYGESLLWKLKILRHLHPLLGKRLQNNYTTLVAGHRPANRRMMFSAGSAGTVFSLRSAPML